jgi:hypothetical protein
MAKCGHESPARKKKGMDVPVRICMRRSCRSNALPTRSPSAETVAENIGAQSNKLGIFPARGWSRNQNTKPKMKSVLTVVMSKYSDGGIWRCDVAEEGQGV